MLFDEEFERRKIQRNPSELHLAALEAVSAPSVLVDERCNVLHLSRTASRFFQQSGGPLARRATELVRSELREELQSLLHQAVGVLEPQLSRFTPVEFEGSVHHVAMLAQQHREFADARPEVLITFLDAGSVRPPNRLLKPSRPVKSFEIFVNNSGSRSSESRAFATIGI